MTIQETLTHLRSTKFVIEDILVLDRSSDIDAYKKTELIDGAVYLVQLGP
jgi:hypothetical protein